MRVFLVGYMGVGKTTIGKKIANRMGLKFIDLDRVISNEVSMSISQIVDTKGEKYFRQLERKSLIKIAKMENVLVATGGGAPCFYDNMKLINQSGVSVFLELDEKSLVKRLLLGQNTRPLLKGKTGNELLDFVNIHLAERITFYNQSDICFNTLNADKDSLDVLVARITNYSK